MKNEKGLGLVTSLSLSSKTCLEKIIFWSDPLNLETGKETKNIQNLKTEKRFLEETKTIFNHF